MKKKQFADYSDDGCLPSYVLVFIVFLSHIVLVSHNKSQKRSDKKVRLFTLVRLILFIQSNLVSNLIVDH